ncbi:MAG: RagB/SusD family nutrient uptake outer membrane protein [Sphingobacteriales bacterium]|nr:RagB/SusD family nutrient uptake outer membrane protein [Sphingobacteriales bacterium]OJY81923.1 MAG: RagB/SusD family nutrient uptake outer membrane protein [Sphingobacteriales bacterium 44-15]
MKKLFYLFAVTLILVSCTKLEETPDSILTTGQFYKTQADAIAAVNSIYQAALNPGGLKMYNRLFLQVIEYPTDDVIAGQRVTEIAARELSAMTQSTSNLRIEQLWQQHYTAIDRANIAIDNIPSIDMDPTLRTRLVNEAKFLRGLLYFNLVRLWGEVPLILHQTTSLGKDAIQVKRDLTENVYAQVIADLTDAEKLPATYGAADAGRATGGAAKAILAKLYLTREEWGKASSKSLEVIQGPYGYALFDKYADVFNVATKNGREHIFSAQCQGEGGNDQGNRMGTSCTPVGIPGIAAAGTDEPTEDAYNIFDANDTRRDVTFFTSLVSPKDGKTYTFAPHFRKYWDQSTITNPTKSNQNVPVIRFAEVLLIYAEALNEENHGPTPEAYNAINQVIRRAYGKPVNIPDPTVDLAALDYSSFKEAVYLQRRKELMLEFQRWFDLVRTGRMITETHKVGKSNASERNYLLPVPQHDIDLNPALLPNNKGW